MKKMNRINEQKGDALVAAIIAVFIVGLMVIQLYIPVTEQYIRVNQEARTKSDIATIIEAVISHRVDETQPWVGTFPTDVATLQTRGYLQFFNNFNVIGNPYVLTITGRTFTVSTDLGTAERANTQAALLGNSVSVTGSTISVAGSAPGDELSHLALLPTDGTRPMIGDFQLSPGIANIEMNENQIRAASLIEARNAAGTGVVSADAVESDVGVFGSLRVVF